MHTQQDLDTRRAELATALDGLMGKGLDGWLYMYDISRHARALGLAPQEVFGLVTNKHPSATLRVLTVAEGGRAKPMPQAEPPKQYTCQDCGKSFPTERKLSQHRGGRAYKKKPLKK